MKDGKWTSHRKRFTAPLVCLIMLTTLGAFSPQLLLAQPPTGAIAYVRPNEASGDQIRSINPDGSSDQLIWSTGQADPEGIHAIQSLSWRPDSTEVAFISTHENACSIDSADLYVVGMNGQDYRRVTQGPNCAALATYPQGQVEVPVRNSSSDSILAFVYFQGAPSVKMISLPPLGTGMVVFENVADFGPGEVQLGSLVVKSSRDIDIATAVDVQAGATVRTAEMSLHEPYMIDWWAHSPTWSRDGLQLGYVLNYNGVHRIDPNPPPLSIGNDLLAVKQWDLPDTVYLLQWGPTAATENQLLYAGYIMLDSTAIYQVTEGSATAGKPLLSFSTYSRILGLAWLPDGSGFIYSVSEYNDWGELLRANIYQYSFATGKSVAVTNFDNEFAGQLSISPDGKQVVFERSVALEDQFSDTLKSPDLWIINLDGSGLQRLVENGRAPSWSRQEPHPPAPEPTATPTQTATPVQTPVQTPNPVGELTPNLYLPLLNGSR